MKISKVLSNSWKMKMHNFRDKYFEPDPFLFKEEKFGIVATNLK